MYDDVNVELKQAELVNEGKGDEEMTDADIVNVELKEVNQEVASAQVQDEAQATTTGAPAQVTSSSRSISSNYAAIADAINKQLDSHKSVVDIHKIKMEKSIVEDEDAMDKGVADRTSKGTTKSQPKFTGKSAQAEDTLFETADTQVPQNPREDMGNTSEPPIVNANPKDWFKKPERPPTLDPEWNIGKTVDDGPTQN
ncbi:hypothetical protein Tco_0932886 [Tanacetum coccineum]